MCEKKEAKIGGFTVTWNGVTPVAGGYEWSYTISQDGSEKDLSNWVLELKNCLDLGDVLPCSLGECAVEEQECPDEGGGTQPCTAFRGIKFDDLPDDTWTQTFTFILPIAAVPTEGCFYLKYGQNRVCGTICVPDCQDDPPCPPCPEDSLRERQTFRKQLDLPESACPLTFVDRVNGIHLCVNGIKIESGPCDLPVELTMCEGTESVQTLTCPLRLEYVALSGELQIFWSLELLLDTDCADEPVPLCFLAVTSVSVDELLYFCEGERPDITPEMICRAFDVQFVSVSASGLLTWSVQFNGSAF